MNKPTIGRTVHFNNFENVVRPAIIVETEDAKGECLLHIFEPKATPNGNYYAWAKPITAEDASVGEIGWFWPPQAQHQPVSSETLEALAEVAALAAEEPNLKGAQVADTVTAPPVALTTEKNFD